jgi:hypothetical protein
MYATAVLVDEDEYELKGSRGSLASRSTVSSRPDFVVGDKHHARMHSRSTQVRVKGLRRKRTAG